MTMPTRIVLCMALGAVSAILFGTFGLAEAEANAASNEISTYVQKIRASRDRDRREELCGELEHHIRNKGTKFVDRREMEQIESLLDDGDPWVRIPVEDVLADIGPQAKSAIPRLVRLLDAARAEDRKVQILGPSFSETVPICFALWKIEPIRRAQCVESGNDFGRPKKG